MKRTLITILFLLFLSACSENYVTNPIIGEAACFQAYVVRPWSPLDQGTNGYVFYDCKTKKVYSTGAQAQSSFSSFLPSPSGFSTNSLSNLIN